LLTTAFTHGLYSPKEVAARFKCMLGSDHAFPVTFFCTSDCFEPDSSCHSESVGLFLLFCFVLLTVIDGSFEQSCSQQTFQVFFCSSTYSQDTLLEKYLCWDTCVHASNIQINWCSQTKPSNIAFEKLILMLVNWNITWTESFKNFLSLCLYLKLYLTSQIYHST